ncbi:MAG: SOS response-associated peptidase family protein [Novosphingobium sp.]
MCNLYRMTKGTVEIARLFAVEPELGANFGEEVYPGYPGLVIAEGRARVMTWGFPLAMTGKRGQPLKPKAVNNAREDKLGTAFWRDSFLRRRCLIPATAWAEAEGERGRMTRSWHALSGGEPFAVAGIWRPSVEWGHAYAMVMTDGCEQMAATHDRMPVVLKQEDWSRWLDGPAERAMPLCCSWEGELEVERTEDGWSKRREPPTLL